MQLISAPRSVTRREVFLLTPYLKLSWLTLTLHVFYLLPASASILGPTLRFPRSG